jgi:propanol-preferring alcohol dehydrogenase
MVGTDADLVPPSARAGSVSSRGDRCHAPSAEDRGHQGRADGGRLLLVGFGSSAHIVLQLAIHRGHKVYVVTRSLSHQRLSMDMGATWAGSDFATLPTRADSAILFAPSGALVPPILESLDRGGRLVIAGIHLSPIPALSYAQHLFHEKAICSVEANTRADGRALLAEAAAANIRPLVKTYALSDASRALLDMKQSNIDGTGVLVME